MTLHRHAYQQLKLLAIESNREYLEAKQRLLDYRAKKFGGNLNRRDKTSDRLADLMFLHSDYLTVISRLAGLTRCESQEQFDALHGQEPAQQVTDKKATGTLANHHFDLKLRGRS